MNLKYPAIRQLLKEVQEILNIEADGLIGKNTNEALELLLKLHPHATKPQMLSALVSEMMCPTGVTEPKPRPIPTTELAPQHESPVPWLDWALGHLGEAEDESEDNNPFIVDLWKVLGITWTHTNDIDSEVPWCAAFVGAALAHTGYQHTGSGLARSYLSYGIPLKAFKRGCVLVWPRGSNPRAGHVDFGVEIDAKGIVTKVGGNVKNQVCLAKRHIKEAIGIRYPILDHDEPCKKVAA